MAKKGKKAKAAAAKAAALAEEPQTETTSTSVEASDAEDLARLTKNKRLFEAVPRHTFEDTSTPFSVPSSPVIKLTDSIQPSPALSAVRSHTDEPFIPTALPPLNIGEVLDASPLPDIDWSLIESNPYRHKKKAKAKASRLRSPVRQDSADPVPVEVHESPVQLPQQLDIDISATPPLEIEAGPAPCSPIAQPETTAPVKEAPPPPPPEPQFHPQYPHYPAYPPYPRRGMSFPMAYPGYGPGPGDMSPYGSPYGGHYPPYPYPHPRKLERHDSMASRGSDGHSRPMTPPQLTIDHSSNSASAVEDDPSDLLGRLHLAIPDLELLLRRYKETHGELGLREALVRKKEAEALETLKRKEEHIDRLMTQAHRSEKESARIREGLRLQLGNAEEKCSELEERLHIAEEKLKELKADNEELKEQSAAVVKERMLIAKAAAEEREKIIGEYEAAKTNAQKQLDAEKIRVADLIKQKHDIEQQAAAVRADLEQRASSIKTNLEAELVTVKTSLEQQVVTVRTELEQQASTMKADLEAKLAKAEEAADQANSKITTLEAELASEKQANADGFEQKCAGLRADLEAEKAALIASQEEEMARLKQYHKDDLNDQTRSFVSLQECLNLKMTKEITDLNEQIATLQKAWDEDKMRSEKLIEELRGVARGMEEEKGRLERIVEEFREGADVKSKGDLAYINSFRQLSDLILELSGSFFDHPPARVSAETHASIPVELLVLLENSAVGLQTRTAYICHLISSILVSQVFTPFLFGLGSHKHETTSFLADVSEHMRAKSALRESTWRQQTLLAAYTTTEAKTRMNKEAGRVIDEILEAILPFCSEATNKKDEMRSAVKKVVKLAVETWRYARLEREKIEAIMPAIDEGFAAIEDDLWLPFGVKEADKIGGEMLLRVFPVIRREPIQECFHVTETDKNDKGCVYSKGLALYKAG